MSFVEVQVAREDRLVSIGGAATVHDLKRTVSSALGWECPDDAVEISFADRVPLDDEELGMVGIEGFEEKVAVRVRHAYVARARLAESGW